ncbi:MAG: tetratricopeptide repeat protein [Gemmatimonadota bacterium]|nr:tetratricopeptide repeat protein [Gemmatimonadota bacterium]
MRALNLVSATCGLLFIGCASSQTVSFLGHQPPDYDVSLVKSLTILGFETSRPEIGESLKSQLLRSLMQHGYFTVVEPDRAAGTRYSHGNLDGIIETGRRLGVDAVITGSVTGGVDDNYATQRNSKRVLDRYKKVVEYYSRSVKETIRVRVKEDDKWVWKNKTVTTVKRVPTEKRVPVYKRVSYTEEYLNRTGTITANLRIIDVMTGSVLASRSTSAHKKYRRLVASNEPRSNRAGKHDNSVSGLLTAIVDIAGSRSDEARYGGRIPGQGEIILELATKVSRELADQLSPRQISIVRQLKKDKQGKAGVSMARNGQWGQAARFWSSVRGQYPENVAVWNNLGVYYEHDGQYGEALNAYQQAVDRNPREGVYQRNLAALMSFVESIQRQTATLGAKIEETDLGHLVSSILEGTLAERLGLLKGDIIEQVNQQNMTTLDDMEREIMHTTKLGAELSVMVMRSGERIVLNLMLGDGLSRIVNVPHVDSPDDSRSASFEPVVDVDEVVPSLSRRPSALGVIMGVEDYRYTPSVTFARHDAMVAHEYFVHALGIEESNIYLRTDRDATQGEFRKVFDPDQGWLAKRIKPEKTEVFIYFVGHGAPDPQTRDAYLVPSDGDPNYPATGFRVDELYRSLNRMPAKNVTLIIDACFSGQVGRGSQMEMLLTGARGIGVESRFVEIAPHLIVLTAAHGNQVSSSYPEMSHGLFTYFVFKGLKGHADENEDDEITVRELFDYVREQVMKRAGYLDREQTPELQGQDLDRVLVKY